MVGPRRACAIGIAASAFLACISAPSPAAAQIGAFGGQTGPNLTPPPVATSRADGLSRPGTGAEALPLGEWLINPSAFAGVLYDSNVGQRAGGTVSGGGINLVPSVLAERNDGIHKTTLYGMADGRAYFNSSASAFDTVSARIGGIHAYQPLPDVILTGQGDFTRQRDVFSTFGIDHGVTTLNPTGLGLSPTINPITYNQFAGALSGQKNFGNMFVSLGGSAVGLFYDTSTGTTVGRSANGATYTGIGRGGIWVTPDLYAFVEGNADLRRYDLSIFDSSGYRAIGGLGSDQIGLFRGEIFGGYQAESYRNSALGTTSSSVFGGRLHYYPLPEFNLSVGVNRVLGVSQLAGSAATPLGTSTRLTTVLAQATYALAPEWSAGGRGGFIQTDYVSNPRRDSSWLAGATLTYSVWRNLGLALDYQHMGLSSNVPFQSFSRDVVTLGLTYKY
jgi:hypothetical protein